MFNLGESVCYTGFNRHILKLVRGSNLKILDIGCGSGELGRLLKAKGHLVYGIEIDKKSYLLSKRKLDKVLLGDISAMTIPKNFRNFDYIIFADVLEHLVNPLAVLEKVKPLLKKEGFVLISVPNIANWVMRLKLLFGIFNYSNSGLLDKTHLRFFTLKSLKRLINSAGYKIIKLDFYPNLVLSIVSLFSGSNQSSSNIIKRDSLAKRFYFRFIFPVEKFISRVNIRLFAYEFIVKIKKK